MTSHDVCAQVPLLVTRSTFGARRAPVAGAAVGPLSEEGLPPTPGQLSGVDRCQGPELRCRRTAGGVLTRHCNRWGTVSVNENTNCGDLVLSDSEHAVACWRAAPAGARAGCDRSQVYKVYMYK